jgi:hypothetical protein
MASTFELADAVPNSNTQPNAPKKAPVLTQVASGAQAARIERVVFTFVNQYGESLPSPEASLYVSANNVVVVQAPGTVYDEENYPSKATGWNVYIAAGPTAAETKQNTTTLVTGGANFQEPSSGLISGSALPTTVVTSAYIANTNIVNTPPATGGIVVPNTAAPTTNRTTSATQSYLATMPIS